MRKGHRPRTPLAARNPSGRQQDPCPRAFCDMIYISKLPKKSLKTNEKVIIALSFFFFLGKCQKTRQSHPKKETQNGKLKVIVAKNTTRLTGLRKFCSSLLFLPFKREREKKKSFKAILGDRVEQFRGSDCLTFWASKIHCAILFFFLYCHVTFSVRVTAVFTCHLSKSLVFFRWTISPCAKKRGKPNMT